MEYLHVCKWFWRWYAHAFLIYLIEEQNYDDNFIEGSK